MNPYSHCDKKRKYFFERNGFKMQLNVLESMNMNEQPAATPVYEHVELPFEGQFVKEASEFVTDAMIVECFNDTGLIHQSAMLEAAKMDTVLKNFMKEGKDYKGLKKDLNTILEANDLPKEEFGRKSSKLLHVCKRVLQVCYDLDAAIGGVVATGGIVAAAATMPAMLPSYIIGYVIAFICNRLLRYAVDVVEFKNLEGDVNNIISDMRAAAKNCEDEKRAAKLNASADKLEESLRKHRK